MTLLPDPLTGAEMQALREDGPVNIFMLDHDPVRAAQWHADRHVVKMILETAQLLSTAWHVTANAEYLPMPDDPADDPRTPWLRKVLLPFIHDPLAKPQNILGEVSKSHWELFGQRIYQPTHRNHPCGVWTAEMGGNYLWLWRLGIALLDEYRHRFAKVHASAPVIWTLEAVPPPLLDSVDTWSEVPPAMPEHLKVVDASGCYDSVESYRRYYALAKTHLHRWTKRDAPPWIGDYNE